VPSFSSVHPSASDFASWHPEDDAAVYRYTRLRAK